MSKSPLLIHSMRNLIPLTLVSLCPQPAAPQPDPTKPKIVVGIIAKLLALACGLLISLE